jgi:transmembrane sensor
MEDHILIRYLKKELSSFERTVVERWINSTTDNKSHFNDLKELWQQLGNIPELASPDINFAWEHIEAKLINQTKLQKRNYLLKIAAAIALIIGCYFIFRLQVPFWKAEKFVSVNSCDSIKKVMLSDGTQVWLNKHSKISYSNRFNKNARKIKLEGEAFFEIHHDNSIPFEVTAQHASIKDIGTSFNICSDTLSKLIKIAVVSGKVSLTDLVSPINETELHQNQVGRLYANHTIRIRNVNTINENAWLTGKMIFHNQLFSDIAETVGDIYNTKFIFSERLFSNIRITASFDHQSLVEIIKVLSETTNLNYKINRKEVIFYK